jgi:NAD binding domain of 6-phosphogluconate dehydrogenase
MVGQSDRAALGVRAPAAIAGDRRNRISTPVTKVRRELLPPVPRWRPNGFPAIVVATAAGSRFAFLGPGVMGFLTAFAGMKWGGIFVDHTAAPATVARELDRDAKSRGLAFIDVPASGGQSGAQNGQVNRTIMCGGDDRDYAQAELVLAAYARSCRLMGPVGAGQLTKMVNQIFIAGLCPGPCRRAPKGLVCGGDRARCTARGRRDFEGRRSNVADGQPPRDHDCETLRLWLC